MLRCFIRCQNLVLFLLIFTLMVLLAGLGLSVYYDEIPVPDRLLQVVTRQLKKAGLDMEFGRITLDFQGNLLIQDATVSFLRSHEPVLKMELLYLDIHYPSLVLGKWPLEQLKLANATLFSPAIVSLSGTTDRLLDHVNLELGKRWSKWTLHYLTARLQNLDIAANGDVSILAAELIKPRKKEQQPDLYLRYLDLAATLSDHSKHLQGFKLPKVEIQLSSTSKSTQAAELEFQAQSFAHADLPVIRKLRQHSSWQVFPELKLTSPLRLNIASIEADHLDTRASDVALAISRQRPLDSLDTLFPVDVHATSGAIEVRGSTINQVVFNGKILSLDHAEGHLIAGIYGGSIQSSLKGNWKNKTVSGSLSGSLNLEPLIARPEFDHLWKLRWSKQHKPLYMDVEFSYPGTLEEATADFRAETREIDIIKTPFQWARARGTLQGTEADVTQLEAGGDGNDLLCTFRQDLRKPYYRFTMVGRFRPHDIDIWWRDWWKNTFDYLDIKGELPWMDFSIRNAFAYKKQLTLFGYAEGENLNLKDMHFDKASVKMFIRPNYIDAWDLKLERPEGQATGQFQRQLEQSQLKNVIVNITSNLDLEPSMELFGESGIRIIEPYTWKGNPTIALLGEFNFENNDPWQNLLFEIDTDQPMTLYNFPFDSLSVEGHYDHGDVLLQEVAFDFAGGKGQGEASYLKQEDQSFLLFDFDIEEAELAETLKRIATVKAVDQQETGKKVVTKSNSEPLEGKLKLHVSGISPAGYGLDRVMAKGNIEITEGNLAQIPLFGPLSGLIPFTKLRLNTAKSFFAWDDGKMSFPDLRMTGNTARLDGVGDFYPSNSSLDFQVRLFLLREADIPLVSSIIMPLFDPFSQMATVNLKGTLFKPEWRFAISPFNLFDSKSVPEPTTVPEELLDFEFRK